jgi:hypothetical protein
MPALSRNTRIAVQAPGNTCNQVGTVPIKGMPSTATQRCIVESQMNAVVELERNLKGGQGQRSRDKLEGPLKLCTNDISHGLPYGD